MAGPNRIQSVLSHPAYREARFCIREWGQAIPDLKREDMGWLRAQIESYFAQFSSAHAGLYPYLRSDHLELLEMAFEKENGLRITLG
ncbi:Uncharacterised protein [uncultured archaeon]|nr:Uncharacterised protein [uncultured archaeon]